VRILRPVIDEVETSGGRAGDSCETAPCRSRAEPPLRTAAAPASVTFPGLRVTGAEALRPIGAFQNSNLTLAYRPSVACSWEVTARSNDLTRRGLAVNQMH
jgi:hypothetical protein